MIRPEDLKPLLESMAGQLGYVARSEFPFELGIGEKTDRPDCVWFREKATPEAALEAEVIPRFSPSVIRQSLHAAFGG